MDKIWESTKKMGNSIIMQEVFDIFPEKISKRPEIKRFLHITKNSGKKL